MIRTAHIEVVLFYDKIGDSIFTTEIPASAKRDLESSSG